MSADVGLFGPDSVTWKLHAEPILFLGGIRALYLQALHPRAVAAIAQNSGYRTDPMGRLLRTAAYVSTVIYGTTEEAEQAGSRLRRFHSRLSAVDSRTGEPFRIDEPDLLRWVHVAEIESFLTTATRAGVSVTPEEADTYYAEQTRAAELVGLDPSTVPASVAEVEAYYQSMQPELALTRNGIDTAAFLTVPPMPDFFHNRALRLGMTVGPPRWAYTGLAATAIGLLPPWARRLYGGLGWPATDLTAALSVRSLRLLVNTVLSRLPHQYRVSPLRRAALERAATLA
ncbi:MAG TPA: oxygenase MpaB family protein [Actinoplanes sp.]|jgi:uncharacterized protein (DUF2236 family)